MRYIPHSPADIALMLQKIGAASVDELFEQIPASARFNRELNLPAPLSESELTEHLFHLSGTGGSELLSFLGGGIYDHFIPAAVDQLLLRSEFYTAYTPYQPEISQGTLQAIFEFQSAICRILEMDTANASMYDGATAMTEAALLARRTEEKTRIVVSAGVHPQYLETLRTYLAAVDGDRPDLLEVPLSSSGRTDLTALRDALPGAACVIVGIPNRFGVVEPVADIASLARTAGARVITSTAEPFAFGVLSPPGAIGADIATAEGQSLAQPPDFGGPGLGLFAIRDDKKLLRQMPGRLVGKTVDVNGKDGFVLTLSTREQHIRREKATSNICTNHGLCALAATINLCLLGKDGFTRLANNCLSLCEYLKAGIRRTDGYSLVHTAPTFNEFAFRCEKGTAAQLLDHMEKNGILGGIPVADAHQGDNVVLAAVTEKHNRNKLDRYLAALASF